MGRRSGGRVAERICLLYVSSRSWFSRVEDRTLRWLRGVLCTTVSIVFSGVYVGALLTIGEEDFKLEQTTLPDGPVLAWNCTIPLLEVECALRGLHRSCDEAKWVILAPLFAEIVSSAR